MRLNKSWTINNIVIMTAYLYVHQIHFFHIPHFMEKPTLSSPPHMQVNFQRTNPSLQVACASASLGT